MKLARSRPICSNYFWYFERRDLNLLRHGTSGSSCGTCAWEAGLRYRFCAWLGRLPSGLDPEA